MNRALITAVLIAILLVSLGSVISLSGAEAQSQSATTNAIRPPELELNLARFSIWQADVGGGFSASAQNVDLEAGVVPGIVAFGGTQAHDFALLSLAYGHMLGRILGDGHWYRGNFEGRLELFGGGQYSPSEDWVIGLTPHLRYNFATGTRWIPFLDAGVGATATGIGPPDLSGTFEFNLQATAGILWFLTDAVALTSDVRLLHMSCAGIHSPNLGVNSVAFMVGVSVFTGR